MRNADPEEIACGGVVDSPAAWFAVLEHARRVANFELAAQAMRELKRLGVGVKFHRPAAPEMKNGHE